MAEGGENAEIKAFANKAAGHAARLAVVIEGFQRCNATSVSAEAMAGAVALVNYFLGEARRIDAMAAQGGGGSVNDMWHAVRKLVADREVPMVYLAEMCRWAPRRLRDPDLATRALGTLVRSGYLVKLPGRPVVDGKARKDVWAVRPIALRSPD